MLKSSSGFPCDKKKTDEIERLFVCLILFFHHPFLAVVAFQCGSHTRILCTEITSEYGRAGQLQSVPPKSNIAAAYNKRHTPIDCRRSAVT